MTGQIRLPDAAALRADADAHAGTVRGVVQRAALAVALAARKDHDGAGAELTRAEADLSALPASTDEAELRHRTAARWDMVVARFSLLTGRRAYPETLALLEGEGRAAAQATGDLRQEAWIEGRIADVHLAARRHDTSLAWRRDKEIPLLERIGDAALLASAWMRTADTYAGKGAHEEALFVRTREVLPRLPAGSPDVAVAQNRIADSLVALGRFDEARTLRETEVLPAFRAAGDTRALAIVHSSLAADDARRGRVEAALARLRNDVERPLEKLSAWAQLADALLLAASILQQRGSLEDRRRAQTYVARAQTLAEAHDLPVKHRIRAANA